MQCSIFLDQTGNSHFGFYSWLHCWNLEVGEYKYAKETGYSILFPCFVKNSMNSFPTTQMIGHLTILNGVPSMSAFPKGQENTCAYFWFRIILLSICLLFFIPLIEMEWMIQERWGKVSQKSKRASDAGNFWEPLTWQIAAATRPGVFPHCSWQPQWEENCLLKK